MITSDPFQLGRPPDNRPRDNRPPGRRGGAGSRPNGGMGGTGGGDSGHGGKGAGCDFAVFALPVGLARGVLAGWVTRDMAARS